MFQAFKPVKLDLISSHNANTQNIWDMTVMKETGLIVVSTPGGTLHQLSLQEGRLIGKEIKRLCEHHLYLLCVQVARREYLALSCEECKDIKLMNLNKQNEEGPKSHLLQHDVIRALSGESFSRMCHGEKNRLFVRSSFVVLELDTSSTTFKKVKTIGSGSSNYSLGMCYVPDPYRLLVVGVSEGACAMFCSDNKTSWIVEMYQGLRIILYTPTHKAILVAHSSKQSLTFLNPGNGAQLQFIRLSDYDIYMHEIQCISFFNDRIIVASKGDRGRISYFSFK